MHTAPSTHRDGPVAVKHGDPQAAGQAAQVRGSLGGGGVRGDVVIVQDEQVGLRLAACALQPAHQGAACGAAWAGCGMVWWR